MYSELMKYFNLVCLMCMSILPVCISVYQVCSLSAQERASDALELELQTAVNGHVGAGNQTQDL